ncbi:MAG: flagellar biosynthetic protein FliR [Bacillota bacterium]|nr:flagellar biosynthetic protein FliR [Bacillota bacterium]
MDFLGSLFNEIDLYFLIWGRITGFLLTAIPFNNRNIPAQVKIWLAALITFLIFMIHPRENLQIAQTVMTYLFQFLGEVLIGAIIGFLTQLVFSTLQLAGQMIDMQIGFGIVNVIDPQYGIQIPVLGNFKYILAVLFFFVINGHHLLLTALTRSYHTIPIGNLHFSGTFYSFIFTLAGELFSTALKISLPVLGALFITDLALGIVARTVPQMNVFIVGLPLKIGVGLGLLMLIMPLFIWIFNLLFTGLFEDLNKLMVILGR